MARPVVVHDWSGPADIRGFRKLFERKAGPPNIENVTLEDWLTAILNERARARELLELAKTDPTPDELYAILRGRGWGYALSIKGVMSLFAICQVCDDLGELFHA